MEEFIAQALQDEIIRPSQAQRFSQALLVPKANGKLRFCIDSRLINNMSEI